MLDDWIGTPWDVAAAAFYFLCWIAYGPVIQRIGGRHSINADMVSIRLRWMRHMAGRREGRLLDGQLIGHILNSSSFFASSNLILIAATAGVLFGGDSAYRNLRGIPLLAHAPRLLFTLKIALVTVTLARSLLDFIWSIRQLNYCIALVGAAPDDLGDAARTRRYADLCGGVFNNALSTFNSGVRGYYFALAAGAWVFGPGALAAATSGSVILLSFRQLASPTARDIRQARAVLEKAELEAPPSLTAYAATPTPMGQTTPVPPMPQ